MHPTERKKLQGDPAAMSKDFEEKEESRLREVEVQIAALMQRVKQLEQQRGHAEPQAQGGKVPPIPAGQEHMDSMKGENRGRKEK